MLEAYLPIHKAIFHKRANNRMKEFRYAMASLALIAVAVLGVACQGEQRPKEHKVSQNIGSVTMMQNCLVTYPPGTGLHRFADIQKLTQIFATAFDKKPYATVPPGSELVLFNPLAALDTQDNGRPVEVFTMRDVEGVLAVDESLGNHRQMSPEGGCSPTIARITLIMEGGDCDGCIKVDYSNAITGELETNVPAGRGFFQPIPAK